LPIIVNLRKIKKINLFNKIFHKIKIVFSQ
jgi:hypothetical protein